MTNSSGEGWVLQCFCPKGTTLGVTCCFVVQLLSCVRLSVIPWTTARQTPLSFTVSQICSNSCPLSRWCHPTISSFVTPFSFCLQSFPASGSFPMSWLFALGGQSIMWPALLPKLPRELGYHYPLWLALIVHPSLTSFSSPPYCLILLLIFLEDYLMSHFLQNPGLRSSDWPLGNPA